MRKRFIALAVACAVTVFGGCAANRPAPSSESPTAPSGAATAALGKIMPASLTEKEERIAALLAPDAQYQILEFEVEGTVKTVYLNRYRLENGAWASEGRSGHTLSATGGRIALVVDNNTRKNRLTLQSDGGSSSTTYDLPEDTGGAGMASGVGYLSEAAEIAAEVEIPLQVQLFTAQSSFSTYDAATAFEQPALYAQQNPAHVYAVTVTFSQKTLDQDNEASQTGTSPVGEAVIPSLPAVWQATPPQTLPDAKAPDPGAAETKTIYEPLYPSFSPNVKTIPFDVINDTDSERGAGDRYRLQRLENGAWLDLPRLPLLESADPVCLAPAISGPFWPPRTRTRLFATVDTIDGKQPLYSLPLQTGVHRLIDEYKNVSTPFEITDAPSDWQQSTIERLSRIPEFAGVTFSPHDFTVPFVCQGVISDGEASDVKFYVFKFPDWREAQAVFDGIKQDGYAIPKYFRQNDTITLRETQQFNWEGTPHFYQIHDEIHLYCGDDAAILSALPDAVTVANPADMSKYREQRQ